MQQRTGHKEGLSYAMLAKNCNFTKSRGMHRPSGR